MEKLTEEQIVKLGNIVALGSDVFAATQGNNPVWEVRDHMRNFLSQWVREEASLMHIELPE